MYIDTPIIEATAKTELIERSYLGSFLKSTKHMFQKFNTPILL